MLGVNDYLERISSLMREWYRDTPELAELKPIQISALDYLARCNHYSDTPLAVAEYLGLTKGTVSQSLKALEKKSLIIKSADANDKRSVHLKLTDEGKALLAKVSPPDFLQQAQDGLPDQGAELLAQLDLLLKQLQSGKSTALFGQCYKCSFHQHKDGQAFCGLTRQTLPESKIVKICREFQHP